MRAIICGGRDYRLTREDIEWLNGLKDSLPITEVVCGMARGADWMSRDWALNRGLPVEPFPANWAALGPAAGPIRNKQMAEYAAQAQGVCIAFPGGTGTANMIAQAKDHGLQVIESPRRG